MEQLIVFGLVALYTVGVGIYRFIKWAGRQVTGGPASLNPVRQALADAQRQMSAPPSVQASPPAQALPPSPLPQQSQAGDAATDADFQRREQELRVESERAFAYFRRRAEELRRERGNSGAGFPPEASQSDGQVPVPAPLTPPSALNGLFQSRNDLVRAIILREALGPPLSRRRPPRSAAPP